MSEHIEVSTVISHIWSDIVFLCIAMDRAHPSYSAATTMTVVTETCCLFFLSATEESLEHVLTLCRFVAMLLASQSHCTYV